ncbi:SDR family NAD(P)-dependent oxidoreductase [Nitriliruptoraceae bacterium ZYF776]|nr:SDR family NAD(P)-dependent oxidoreductase [Profundirhabdus halotolerans]
MRSPDPPAGPPGPRRRARGRPRRGRPRPPHRPSPAGPDPLPRVPAHPSAGRGRARGSSVRGPSRGAPPGRLQAGCSSHRGRDRPADRSSAGAPAPPSTAVRTTTGRPGVAHETRTVVVTGASSGIGRAVATALTGRGDTVVGVARRADALETLAADLGPGRFEPHPADVTDAAALARVADDVEARHGRIDAWINLAGVAAFGDLHEVPIVDAERVLATDLGGVVHGSQLALTRFRADGRGVLVNVSSVLGLVPAAGLSSYVAAKHAVHGLTASLHGEVRDLPDVHVCEVAPGPVDTPLFAEAGDRTGAAPTPLDPLASAERVAATIVRLLDRPRRLVATPPSMTGLLLLSRLSPRTAAAVLHRAVAAFHLDERRPRPHTAGNLHDPGTATSTEGGWRAVDRPGSLRHGLGSTIRAALGRLTERGTTARPDAARPGR